jgi:hypothetical protein
MWTNRNNMTVINVFSVLLALLSASALYGQELKSTSAEKISASAIVVSNTKDVTVGAFTVKVPTEWTNFGPSDASALRKQYMEQSEQIYQQYSGAPDSTKSVDIAGFNISKNAGSFVIVSFTVPPQSDLITLLKSEVGDKMDWGVRKGYIRKYLGLVSVDDDTFSGFYTKTIGNEGEVDVSGALEHKNLKNTIIQLTLLCPKGWDETKATKTLADILKSVILKNNIRGN